MLMGAVAALIAWGIAYLILKGGSDGTRMTLAAVAGIVGAIVISYVLSAAIMGSMDIIPVGGIVGAIIGVVGAIAAAKKNATAVPKA